MDAFKEQMEIIKNYDYQFYNPKIFVNEFSTPKEKKKNTGNYR